jgi:hypothetical protein
VPLETRQPGHHSAAILLASSLVVAAQTEMLGAADTMFRIAINDVALLGKIPAGDPRWATFNDTFRNRTLSRMAILRCIEEGHAYTTWHEGRRKLENFIAAQHIAIDMDTDDERSEINTLINMEFVRMYSGIIHTTPSHTAQTPRARIIFLLDRPITSTDAYAAAARFIIAQFDAADDACKDASRFFFGMAPDGQSWVSNNILEIAKLRVMYRQWQKRHPQRNVERAASQPEHDRRIYKPTDYADWTDMLLEPVRHAPQGDRNNTLNKQAFFAGKDIAKARINEADIIPQLVMAAQAVGLSEAEAMRTIQSGIRSGKQAM